MFTNRVLLKSPTVEQTEPRTVQTEKNYTRRDRQQREGKNGPILNHNHIFLLGNNTFAICSFIKQLLQFLTTIVMGMFFFIFIIVDLFDL